MSLLALARAARVARPLLRPQQQLRLSSSGTAVADNTFVRERMAVKEHAAQTADLWLKISLYVVPVSLLAAGANAYYLWNQHWEHWSHMPPLEERVEYPYQNIRVKNFPWGDGDKTLFWNTEVNYHNKDKTT